jgi:DGQHR domain-containing protein
MAKTSRKVNLKKGKRPKKAKLTEQQKLQNFQQRELRNIMTNMGFSRPPSVDGTQFVYESRSSEIDDIFIQENVILITEYTIADPPTSHITNKKLFYDLVNTNPTKFIKFLLDSPLFVPFKTAFNSSEASKYSLNQLQIRILYVSKFKVPEEHRLLVKDVIFFDYPIVKYFESIAKIIKRTAKYEFFDFLNIEIGNYGANIKSGSGSSDDFFGHILPEEQSSFKEGYKIVSFYIDAGSLLKRAFVLRKDGWRNTENVGLYQRMLLQKKMKSLRKYLNDEKRVFINNIIVTIPIEKIKLLDSTKAELQIDDDGNFKSNGSTKVQPTTIQIESGSNIIGIIDGQHRSYSYHEGDDVYEKEIAKIRESQNLLVTGILYPKNELEDKRMKFEAKLFMEINATQAGADTNVKQEIISILNPFSSTSISKHILTKLNANGPLQGQFTQYWYESTKIKTSSIISFGLRPLLKLDGNDSIFKLWSHAEKDKLKIKDENFALLQEYKTFAVDEIRKLFIAFKDTLSNGKWVAKNNDPNAILNVTTINGIINLLRLLIENGKTGDVAHYKTKLKDIDNFMFKSYKSSQYRQMGIDMYDKYFK